MTIEMVRTLRGLPGVEVVVENFRRQAEDAGFDPKDFTREVELRLRLAGIRAFAAEDREVEQPAMLYLNVNVMHRDGGKHGAYSVDLDLIQPALLWRHLSFEPATVPSEEEMKSLVATVRTWSKGAVGFGDLADVRSTVRDVADEFVNDWLAVNPVNGNPPPA